MEGGIYFVTFRLEDSLPAAVCQQIRERKRRFEEAKRSGRKMAPKELETFAKLSSRHIEELLDAGAGCCYMKDPRIAQIVAAAIQYWDDQRYRQYAWCVMPNHVHSVFKPIGIHTLSSVMSSWKSYTVKPANKLLARKGHFWEREYYDHLIRDDAELQRAIVYVRDNPIRAGLRDWPWVWCAGEDAARDSRRDGGATS
jgi:REP element-mobilizing transposase RayT